MTTFLVSDNGIVPERWPHTPEDHYPSIKVIMFRDTVEIGHAVVMPERKRLVNIFINKEFRNKGQGSRLLDHVIEEYEIDKLTVFPYDNSRSAFDLVKWYINHGFDLMGNVEMERK